MLGNSTFVSGQKTSLKTWGPFLFILMKQIFLAPNYLSKLISYYCPWQTQLDLITFCAISALRISNYIDFASGTLNWSFAAVHQISAGHEHEAPYKARAQHKRFDCVLDSSCSFCSMRISWSLLPEMISSFSEFIYGFTCTSFQYWFLTSALAIKIQSCLSSK